MRGALLYKTLHITSLPITHGQASDRLLTDYVQEYGDPAPAFAYSVVRFDPADDEERIYQYYRTVTVVRGSPLEVLHPSIRSLQTTTYRQLTVSTSIVFDNDFRPRVHCRRRQCEATA